MPPEIAHCADDVGKCLTAFLSQANSYAPLISAFVAVGALVVGIGAWRVAGQAVRSADRSVALTAVPMLFCDRPGLTFEDDGTPALTIPVTNASQVPALGVWADVIGESSQHAIAYRSQVILALGPSSGAQGLYVPADEFHERSEQGRWLFEVIKFRVYCQGPRGAAVTLAYEWARPDEPDSRPILHESVIDPADGGPEIRSAFRLKP